MEVIYPVYLAPKGNLVFKCRHHGVGRGGGNREDKKHDFNERKKKNLLAQTNAISKLRWMPPC